MFPERQRGPHRDWRAEVEYLDQIFPNGAAYTVGKVNGDHWLLYITSPGEDMFGSTAPNSPAPQDTDLPVTKRKIRSRQRALITPRRIIPSRSS